VFHVFDKPPPRNPFPRPRRQPHQRSKPILEALEDRMLPSFAAPLNLPTGEVPQGIAAADLTANGIQDLVVANNGFSDGSASSLSNLPLPRPARPRNPGNAEGLFPTLPAARSEEKSLPVVPPRAPFPAVPRPGQLSRSSRSLETRKGRAWFRSVHLVDGV
jgi:hypothetical protein